MKENPTINPVAGENEKVYTNPNDDPAVEELRKEILTATNLDPQVRNNKKVQGLDNHAEMWSRINMRESIHRWSSFVASNPEKAQAYRKQISEIDKELTRQEEQVRASEAQQVPPLENQAEDIKEATTQPLQPIANSRSAGTVATPAESVPAQNPTPIRITSETMPIESTPDQADISPMGAKKNPEGRILDGSVVNYQGSEWILEDYDAYSGNANLVKKLPGGAIPGEGDMTQISQEELYSLFGRSIPSPQEAPLPVNPDKPILDLSEAQAPKDKLFVGDKVWHDNHQWELEGFDMETGEARLQTEIVRRDVSIIDPVTKEEKIVPEEVRTVHIKIPQKQLYAENTIEALGKKSSGKTYETEYGTYTEEEMKASDEALKQKKAERIRSMENETREKVLDREEKIAGLKQRIGKLAERQQREMDKAPDDASKQAVADKYKKYQGKPEREIIKQKALTKATKSKGLATKWFEKLFG